jgi:hypothetical protein
MFSFPPTPNVKKMCVFCGNLPDEKTKEHVIPKWLIEFTGDPNRTVFLGFDLPHFIKTGEIKKRQYAFSAFHFPACSSCNSEFSKLESDTKLLMHKIFAGEFLDNGEITTLLDWFDKVRMGLWLAFITLDDLTKEFTPRLYIKNRQKQKDRALFIYDIRDTTHKELGISGVNSPIFNQVPGCFMLRINSKLFFNASTDFLTSKSLGFNYGRLDGLDEHGLHQVFSTRFGTRKPVYPVVGFPYANGAMEIYQAISSKELSRELKPGAGSILADDAYLLANYLPTHSNEHVKVSKIFYKEVGSRKISLLQDDEELDITPTIPKSAAAIENIITEMIAKTQVWFFRRRFPADMLPEPAKKELLKSQAGTFSAQKSFVGS